MKKTIIFYVLLLVATLNASAIDWFTADKINIKQTTWAGWEPCTPTIDVSIDTEKKEIVIFSQTTQIFNYVTLKEKQFKDYVLFTGNATDTDYVVATLNIYFYKNSTIFIHIQYTNIEYIYSIEHARE